MKAVKVVANVGKKVTGVKGFGIFANISGIVAICVNVLISWMNRLISVLHLLENLS